MAEGEGKADQCERLKDAVELMEAAMRENPLRPHRTIEGAAGLRMGLDAIESFMDLERQLATALRKVRRQNRDIFGVFRWRWRLDRLMGWALLKLARKDHPSEGTR